MSIGAALKTWRTGQELTQADAARKMNVSQAAWCEWEADKTLPSSDKAFDLEDATGGAVTARMVADAIAARREQRRASTGTDDE